MLRRESIDATELAEEGPLTSKRPLILVIAALGALVGLGVYISRDKAQHAEEVMNRASIQGAGDLVGAAADRESQAELEVLHAHAQAVDSREPEQGLTVTEAVPPKPETGPGSPAANMVDPTSLNERRKRALIEETFESEMSARDSFKKAVSARGEVALGELANGAGGSAAQGAGAGAMPDGELDAMQASIALMTQRLQAGGLGNGLGGGAGQGGPGAAGPAGMGGGQQQSEDFFRNGGSDLDKAPLVAARQKHRSPFVLLQGTFFKGKLLTAINSDLPGMIRGKITEDVYDSATGAHLLVPKGSFVVGRYSSDVNAGQQRVQMAWTRLNYPDGSFMDLGSMSGGDESGASGLKDRLNRHLGRRIGLGILLSTMTISHEVMAPANGAGFGSAVHRGTGDAIVQMGAESIKQEMAIPPTIEIRAGARFTIHVNRDLVFTEPYKRVRR